MHLLPKISPQQAEEIRQQKADRVMMQREAAIGGQLFGPVPKGHSRQFFCLDEHTWIWYETWIDDHKKTRTITTRYDVRQKGVLKIQDGLQPQYVGIEEARHLYKAVQLYQQRVDADYVRTLQSV